MGLGSLKMSLLPDGQVSTNFEVNRNGFKCHKSVFKIISIKVDFYTPFYSLFYCL